jgi:transcriptional regulator with XRE-family HTH domain
VNVSRKDISPVWTRSFPISRQPQTIGEHLRKKRFSSGIRQSEAARLLDVSQLTLSLWERDKVYPSWSQQSKITAYLGYDLFTDPALGRPKGNETPYVAFLASNEALSLGHRIRLRRLKLRKTGKQCAKELGISVKTLWSWETNRRQPTVLARVRLVQLLGVGL